MHKTCENWLGLVNSCVHYAYQTCDIYQVLPYSVDFKAQSLNVAYMSDLFFLIFDTLIIV